MTKNTNIYVVYVTHASKKDATKVVEALLAKKLIACANVFSAGATYVWKGKTKNVSEWVTLLKTTKPSAVEKEILNIHPYDVPCVLAWKVSANAEFGSWVADCCK